MGDKVVAVSPSSLNPFLGAIEIDITGRNTGRLASASNYASHGEPVRRVCARSGKIVEVWLAGNKLVPGPKLSRELKARYGEGVARRLEPEPGVSPRAPKRQRAARIGGRDDRRSRARKGRRTVQACI
jgi:hypothetical protein